MSRPPEGPQFISRAPSSGRRLTLEPPIRIMRGVLAGGMCSSFLVRQLMWSGPQVRPPDESPLVAYGRILEIVRTGSVLTNIERPLIGFICSPDHLEKMQSHAIGHPAKFRCSAGVSYVKQFTEV